jgi:hypothetical protein
LCHKRTSAFSLPATSGFEARCLGNSQNPGVKVAAPDRFIAWCKQEQASIEQQLELLQSGKVRTGEDIGAGWIDTTEQSIERARARLSELNDLLTEAGTATVVKPSAL